MTESIVRIASLALGAIALLSVVLIGALAFQKRDVPEGLFALASGCVTALATMLTSFTPAPMRGGRRVTDPPELPDSAEQRAA